MDEGNVIRDDLHLDIIYTNRHQMNWLVCVMKSNGSNYESFAVSVARLHYDSKFT